MVVVAGVRVAVGAGVGAGADDVGLLL